ncbi:keratin-associated protein 13-1-like, partial [Globicephala melas]|uniref:keratin-associated protein 13-1-like n=1 Tax=Globicephala melas TaxID=9731 RepID=UPI00122F166E
NSESSHCNSAELTSPVNMSYNRCSGKFSFFLGDHLCYSGSSCGSSYPATWSTGTGTVSCSPTTCQLGSSLYSGCQETCCKPTRYQTFYVLSRPSQISCYHSTTSTLCRPSQTTYSRSLGFGSSNSCSLGYGSGSSYLPGCGSSSFRPVAYRVRGFPSLNYGSRFCYPSYFTSGNFQSCYRPTCGSGSY